MEWTEAVTETPLSAMASSAASADALGLAYSSLATNAEEDYMKQECVFDHRLLNMSEYEYPYRKETWGTITWREMLKILAYIAVFLVSLTGNLLVIVVVYYNAHMRTSTNQYLVNLAAADLLVTLFCMWVHIVRHLSYPNYVLPALFCKLDGFVQALSLLASVLTLTVISVGRFVAVMFPLHARTSPDRAHRVIAAVWITAALLSCPMLFYRHLYSVKWLNFTTWTCDEIWPIEGKFDDALKHCVITYNAKVVFYTILIIAFYFLPVVVMLISYSLVVWKLWVTQLPGEHPATSRITATRSKRKVVKMVSVVLLVFVICWTPLQSLLLYSSFIREEHGSFPDWFHAMEFAAYFIAYLNSALNPIIYCGFNINFRQGLVSLLTCRHASNNRMYHRRNWKVMTRGTRETTVGCSGPEPAVLLEFHSLKRNVLFQKYSMTPSHTGPVGTTGSSKDLSRSTIGDLNTDFTCKNSAQEMGSGPNSSSAYNHEGSPRRSDLGFPARGGSTRNSRSSCSSSNSRTGKDCSCCSARKEKTKRKKEEEEEEEEEEERRAGTLPPEDDIYQLSDLKGRIVSDAKGEML